MKGLTINRLIQVMIAIILLQTLFFKFTASQESVYIFSKLHCEPYGRIFSGVVELISSMCLFVKSTRFFGALVALITMLGAIIAHLFILGIEVNNDNGILFSLALIVFISSLTLLLRYSNVRKILNNNNL